MKAYKGLKKTVDGYHLMCMNMCYVPDVNYEIAGDISLCRQGFHACHELYQVWHYYPNNGNNVFYEVECGGKIIESDTGDGKLVCSEIKLLREIDVSDVERFRYCQSGDVENKDIILATNLDGHDFFIDRKGKNVFGKTFRYASVFMDGYSIIQTEKDKYNVIDTKGELVFDKFYRYIMGPHEGFFAVRDYNNMWNFLDTSGRPLMQRWCDMAFGFNEGFGRCWYNGEKFYVDAKGNLERDAGQHDIQPVKLKIKNN